MCFKTRRVRSPNFTVYFFLCSLRSMTVKLLMDNIFMERLGLQLRKFGFHSGASTTDQLIVKLTTELYCYDFIVLHYCGPECPKVSTTSITAIGCWQCLPLSVVQLKGKHCQNPHCHNGVVDTFEHWKPNFLNFRPCDTYKCLILVLYFT